MACSECGGRPEIPDVPSARANAARRRPHRGRTRFPGGKGPAPDRSIGQGDEQLASSSQASAKPGRSVTVGAPQRLGLSGSASPPAHQGQVVPAQQRCWPSRPGAGRQTMGRAPAANRLPPCEFRRHPLCSRASWQISSLSDGCFAGPPGTPPELAAFRQAANGPERAGQKLGGKSRLGAHPCHALPQERIDSAAVELLQKDAHDVWDIRIVGIVALFQFREAQVRSTLAR